MRQGRTHKTSHTDHIQNHIEDHIEDHTTHDQRPRASFKKACVFNDEEPVKGIFIKLKNVERFMQKRRRGREGRRREVEGEIYMEIPDLRVKDLFVGKEGTDERT